MLKCNVFPFFKEKILSYFPMVEHRKISTEILSLSLVRHKVSVYGPCLSLMPFCGRVSLVSKHPVLAPAGVSEAVPGFGGSGSESHS